MLLSISARHDIRKVVREAASAGAIAFALFAPFVGFETVLGPGNALMLDHRWGTAFSLSAVIFALKLAAGIVGVFLARRRQSGHRDVTAPTKERRSFFGASVPVCVALAVCLPFLPGADRYWIDLATLILTYTMLGWGLNIVVGLAGLLDLGYVAFYAVGAYTYALLATNSTLATFFGQWIAPGFWPLWSFWICLPVAAAFAALWGILLGFPVLRLRGDYLAIVTLGFGEIIRLLIINWTDLTGGPEGIASIPRPSFFGLPFTAGDEGFASRLGIPFDPIHRIIFLYYLILLLALCTSWISLRLRRLPVGRAWEAMREDEIACQALGVNLTNTKLAAFAAGAMFAGLAGAFFATRQGFISPESFIFQESALVLAIVVLGGMGSQTGIAVAAAIMVGGIEVLRRLDFLKAVLGSDFEPSHYRMLLFGFAMVAIMLWRPRGVVGTRAPSFIYQHPTMNAAIQPVAGAHQ